MLKKCLFFFGNFEGSHGGVKKRGGNEEKMTKKSLVNILCIFKVLGKSFVLQKFRGQNMTSRKNSIFFPQFSIFEGSYFHAEISASQKNIFGNKKYIKFTPKKFSAKKIDF